MRYLVHSLALLSAAALLAAPAGAQYGGRQDVYAHDASLDVPYVAPSVAALAVRFGGALQLSQHQLDAIQAVREHQDSVRAPWMHMLDSLRNGPRPVNPYDLSQEQREAVDKQRALTKSALDSLRQVDADARKQVMAVLTPDQQAKAARLERDAQGAAREQGERSAEQGWYGRRGGRNRVGPLAET